jgi:hypothetical protein
MTQPKFFTFIEETYSEPAAVPDCVRAHLRVLWLDGARVDQFARTFKMPAEWVDEFVHEEQNIYKPN